jgi:magnesium transporter
LFDLGFPLLDHLTDEISELEQQMLENPKSSDLKRILQLRGQLAGIRRIVAPQREIVAQLSRQEAAQVSERTSHYLRDVANHLVRLAESIDQCRDRLNGTFEAYISVTSMRTNEIMKSLTLLSAVFLPLTFVVGFFGQNFDTLPWVGDWTHSRGLGNLMVAFCLATPPAMLLWFRAKEWL